MVLVVRAAVVRNLLYDVPGNVSDSSTARNDGAGERAGAHVKAEVTQILSHL
jgi:hypothetical protein